MKVELTEKQVNFLIRAALNSYAEKDSDFDIDLDSGGIAFDAARALVACGGASALETFQSARVGAAEPAPIYKRLFMTGGWLSKVAANRLHRRLQFAMQQQANLERSGTLGPELDSPEDKVARINIRRVIVDLMLAFDLNIEDFR